VSKASGLRAALAGLGETMSACVAVGDAENDLPMLAAAGCGVAVANALNEVKAAADLVVSRSNGSGILELVGRLVTDDLAGACGGTGGIGAVPR
jgi:hydroxymethylpyrimidine pyrophosphatase-like HAD family hydrolase